MAAISSVAQIEAELREMLGPDTTLADSYFQDYSEIASLMTNSVACEAKLAELNTQLVHLADLANIRKVSFFRRNPKMKLRKETFKYTATDGRGVSGKFRKHGNILKSYLDTWETIQGFNQGNEEGGLPARPPLLTGIVQGADFRKYLLRHGYHWTDIGVAGSHGEFTHRLHWYIICTTAEANPGWLTNSPVELFKKCSENSTVATGPNNTIWDRLFDFLTAQVIKSTVPTNGHDTVYRKAETLHAFLKNPVTKRSQNLWLLAQIVDSRAGRVQLINTLQGGTGTRLDQDIANRQDQLEDELLLKGDLSSKIVWQKLQEDDTKTLDEFLR